MTSLVGGAALPAFHWLLVELTQQLLKRKPHIPLDKHDILNMFRYTLLQVTLH